MLVTPRRAAALVAAALVALVPAGSAVASDSGGAEWRAPEVPATPVACGQTITTDVRLANDLVDCPGPGLIVGAAGITIDLRGHTIDGDGRFGGTDAGIDNGAKFTDVTIKNGTIKEFDAGVKIGALPSTPPSAPTRNTLRRLSVIDANEGIWVIRSDENDLQRNRVDGVTGGIGIDLLGSSHNDVERNVLVRNGTGIELTGADDNKLARNAATANAVGIAITSGSTGNDAVRNLLVSNNETGVFLGGAHDTALERNLVASNPEDGIDVLSSTGTELVRNVVLRNGGKPVFREGDGILVDANSSDTELRRNRSDQNGDDGIDVRSADSALSRNRADDNHDLGIFAVEGVDDAGRNRAEGNGNPDQCSGVVCS